jgi:hypothetical protein
MESLASQLASVAEHLAGQPRIYADANVPAGVVGFMRTTLRWDVLFVTEHDDLRRSSDSDHYRLAQQLRRTLLTLDRDYLDDRRFPPRDGAGVLVLSAPDASGMTRLLSRLDRAVFRPRRRHRKDAGTSNPLPLAGRKLHAHPDWRPGSAGSGSVSRDESPLSTSR